MGTHAKSSLYLVSLDLVGQKVIFFVPFYQSVENGFASFHLYVCAAFLKNFSQEITQESDFQVCLFVFFFTCSHLVQVTLQDLFFSIVYYVCGSHTRTTATCAKSGNSPTTKRKFTDIF